MHNKDLVTLSKYRLNQAKEMLIDSQLSLDNGRYKTCNNRAYYAIFHAMRAVHALTGYDSAKHSGIIAEFQRVYIKNGIFDKECSFIIKTASEIRNDSDYEDFYITSREEAQEQLANARLFVDKVESYLEQRYNSF